MEFSKVDVYLQEGFLDSYEVYLSRGVLVDDLLEGPRPKDILKQTLYYMPGENIADISTVVQFSKEFRVLEDKHIPREYYDCWVTWKVHSAICDEIGQNPNETLHRKAKVNHEVYPELEFPTVVQLECNDETQTKPGFHAFINLNPNESGGDYDGMVFFPDNSWLQKEELYPWFAKVTITKQMKTYGFITGEMEPLRCLNCEEVKQFLFEKDARGDIEISKWRVPVVGIAYSWNDHGGQLIIHKEEDGVKLTSFDFSNSECLEVHKICELVLQKAWGENFSLNDFLNINFTQSEFLPQYVPFGHSPRMHRHITSDWIIDDILTDSSDKELQQAVADEIVVVWKVLNSNIQYLIPQINHMGRLHDMTQEQATMLLRKISDFNMATDEAIRSKLRKGKLRLSKGW